jgi:mono/diheme cytochrome c family protein
MIAEPTDPIGACCQVHQENRWHSSARGNGHRFIVSAILVLCFAWGIGIARYLPAQEKLAQETPAKELAATDTVSADTVSADTVNTATLEFFSKHCHSCHSGTKPKGEFRINDLSRNFADKPNRVAWLAVLEQLKAGNMPPPEKPRPAAEEIETLTVWIEQQVARAEGVRNAAHGRVVMRRLNRNEYANTVRDLMGVDVELKDLLPESTSTSGFDNSAEALHVSSYLMSSYLSAADRVLDAAIANSSRPRTIKQRHDIKDEKTVKPTGSVYRHLDDGVAIFSSWVSANIQVTLWRFQTRRPGKYRFRISGYGFQTEKPVVFHVKAGPMNASAQQYLMGYFEVPANEPTVIEFVQQMEANHTIRIVTDGLGAIPPEIEKIGAENYQGPGLVVQWVEVEGPLLESWPPPSHHQLLGELKQIGDPNDRNRLEVASDQPLEDAQRILLAFVRRAFRRDVTEEDVKPFLTRIEAKLAEGYSFEQALRVGLKAVLVSPDFLFLRETAGSAGKGKDLDDFALASRLSYFLWSSMPDEELLTLADRQELRQPEMLRQQVERMLSDSKSSAFTENFVGQWLGLRAIDATTPDRMLYPEYDDILKESMVTEVELFFSEVLKEDLSLTNFVDSDFTMLNGRLADHYGFPGIHGLGFRKFQLPAESHRGGVLSMAAVLKVTANGTTTSPIIRGAWVLERILGTPPPKPTVDIEAVEPDIRGATTIREQLEKHRQDASCAVCHVKIDPPGFALENYDVIGGWRDRYRSVGEGELAIVSGRRMRYRYGPHVDASDILDDGRRFENIVEYKELLLDDKDQLARALADKLVTYATGATPTSTDRPEIEAIVNRIRDENYGLRSLVHEVVQSKVFQRK